MTATAWGLLVLLVGILAWDVWLALDGKPATTISATAFRARPWVRLVVVFALGVLCGHFGWAQDAGSLW